MDNWMDGWMDGLVDGWVDWLMGGLLDGWMGEKMDGQMDELINEWVFTVNCFQTACVQQENILIFNTYATPVKAIKENCLSDFIRNMSVYMLS